MGVDSRQQPQPQTRPGGGGGRPASRLIIIIIIKGLSLLQSTPLTTANKQTQAQKKAGYYLLFY